MNINLNAQLPQDIFDYQQLLHALSGYAQPRIKISQLIDQGVIIRIRKGLYAFGSEYRKSPLCLEWIANLLYGPSYVSLDYALSYHGLISERVSLITSITTGRSRKYDTPVGYFSYQMVSLNAYQVGMMQVDTGNHIFLMATPEKALIDKVASTAETSFRSVKRMLIYLIEDLRIDEADVMTLNVDHLKIYSDAYGYEKCRLMVKAVEKIQS